MTVGRESWGGELEGNPPQAVRQHAGGTKVLKVQNERVLTELLDLEEVARRLATSPRHVRRMVFERRIPYVKVGRFVRFVPGDLVRWLEDQRVRPSGRALTSQSLGRDSQSQKGAAKAVQQPRARSVREGTRTNGHHRTSTDNQNSF